MKKNKQLHFLAPLFLLVSTIAGAQPSQTPAQADDRGYIVKVGDQAPDDFELVLNNGKTTSLKQLRGKVVVLQFTASWCSVCRSEMPHLESDVWVANQQKSFVLIGVDRDEPIEKVQKFHIFKAIDYNHTQISI